MDKFEVTLKGPKNQIFPALLRPIDLVKDTISWFVNWYPRMNDLAGRRLYQDSHWNVAKIWQELATDPHYRIKVIEADDLIQGYIILRVNGYLGIDKKPCTYVSFLATAPWNRFAANERSYQGVGKKLMSVAVFYSAKIHGNLIVELHSLPDAEDFYRGIGMRETGRRSKNNLKEFRLEHSEALALIRPILSERKPA